MKKYLIPCLLLAILSCSKDESSEQPGTTNQQVQQFNLSVSAGEGGTVSSSGGQYDKGTEVTLTATPNAEFLFVDWSNGSTENPLRIIVNSDLEISANFEKRKYALTINVEGEGTVAEEVLNAGKVTTDYTSGSTIRLTAQPSEEWSFVSWGGAAQGSENPIEITIDEAKEVTATFEINQYNLGLTSNEGGNLDVESGSFDFGTEIVVTAIADNNYIFSHWSDDSEENPRAILITSDTELRAIFKNKFEIEDGYYTFVGQVDQNNNPIYFETEQPFTFEYLNNQAVSCGAIFNDVASFPIFRDLGYIPGEGDLDENLNNVYLSRNELLREYFVNGNRHTWLLRQTNGENLNKKTHSEIMELVEGKGFWSDPIYSEIDPLVPETYVIAFIKDAERHGVDLSFVDTEQIAIELSNNPPADIPGVVGLSFLSCIDDERVMLWYLNDFWKNASYFDIQNERLTVMYHELGHDILNSGHPATGDMKQFMNTLLGDDGPIVWDDSNPMFSFRRMVDDMFSGVGLDYPCSNGATDYSNGNSSKSYNSGKNWEHKDCFHNRIKTMGFNQIGQ